MVGASLEYTKNIAHEKKINKTKYYAITSNNFVAGLESLKENIASYKSQVVSSNGCVESADQKINTTAGVGHLSISSLIVGIQQDVKVTTNKNRNPGSTKKKSLGVRYDYEALEGHLI